MHPDRPKTGPGTGRGQFGGEWSPDHREDCGAQDCPAHDSDADIAQAMTRSAELGSSEAARAERRFKDEFGI